jgi:hypothetical protein
MTHHASIAYIAAVALCAGAAALAPNGSSFDLSWNTVDGGGGISTAGDYELAGTIGQPDAGVVMTGGDFTFTGGFWPAGAAPEPDCPADLNNDDVVDVMDLLQLLSDWGSCPDCPADLNDDDAVDVADLLLVLAQWGPCPQT